MAQSKKNGNKWKELVEKELGINVKETMFASFTWEKMQFVMKSAWWGVLSEARDNNLEVRNLVAIMGKDTRKTTVFMIFMWFLMHEYEWLNSFVLRDTILKSQTQMKMQLRKAASLIENEYGVEHFQSSIQEGNDGFYFVRDSKSKSNQKSELLSFDSIVELGGFTTSNGCPAIFIYDELQNPNSSKKEILSNENFLANYKFIDSKNRAIEISTGKKLPKWIPRHYFLSNRYVSEHPLNNFSQRHFPYYDSVEGDETLTGVRSWMIENPKDNNFAYAYVGEDNVDPEWSDFSKTVIVYGSKLSNELLRADAEWEEEQLRLIKRGRPEDLAVIIGDIFEGTEYSNKAYHHSQRIEITREEIEEKYLPFCDTVRIAIDIDFSRQITIRPKYSLAKDTYVEGLGMLRKFRVIRETETILPCSGVSSDGAKTEMYLKSIHKALLERLEYVKKTMPHIKKMQILFDDNWATTAGRFNFGDFQNSMWIANSIKFKTLWKICERPKIIDEFQDSGYIIDVKHPSNAFLHSIYSNWKIDADSKDQRRIERDNDKTIDSANADEYGLWHERPKLALHHRTTRMLGGNNEW